MGRATHARTHSTSRAKQLTSAIRAGAKVSGGVEVVEYTFRCSDGTMFCAAARSVSRAELVLISERPGVQGTYCQSRLIVVPQRPQLVLRPQQPDHHQIQRAARADATPRSNDRRLLRLARSA